MKQKAFFSKQNTVLFWDFFIYNGKSNMLKRISILIFFPDIHYHLKQMKYKYPTSGELKLQQKYFLVTSCASTLIT